VRRGIVWGCRLPCTREHPGIASRFSSRAARPNPSHHCRPQPPAMSTMLCTRCIGRVPAARSLFPAVSRRTYADDAAPNPLITPLTPGPSKLPAAQSVVRSSVPAGTKLYNINYFKNKPDPVAMEDGEYPAWLWSGLESGKTAAETAEEAGDLYCMCFQSNFYIHDALQTPH
jgi:hypothetical protein